MYKLEVEKKDFIKNLQVLETIEKDLFFYKEVVKKYKTDEVKKIKEKFKNKEFFKNALNVLFATEMGDILLTNGRILLNFEVYDIIYNYKLESFFADFEKKLNIDLFIEILEQLQKNIIVVILDNSNIIFELNLKELRLFLSSKTVIEILKNNLNIFYKVTRFLENKNLLIPTVNHRTIADIEKNKISIINDILDTVNNLV